MSFLEGLWRLKVFGLGSKSPWHQLVSELTEGAQLVVLEAFASRMGKKDRELFPAPAREVLRCYMPSMTHIVVTWHHENPDEPVELFSELNDERFEVRKVEVFRDGRKCFADASAHSGNTSLGIVPVPSLEEIASDRHFTPRTITREEFEAAWLAATRPGK